ncbi:MAG: hypothetical protein WC628_10125 [Candidatus Omnitrophota bacterium]
MIFRRKYFYIIITAIVLTIFAISLAVPFFRVKPNPIITFALALLIITIILSIISLLRLEPGGRILVIADLFLLSIVSLGGILFIGFTDIKKLTFWFIVLSITLYLIYQLNKKDIKELFQKKDKK